MSSPTAPDIPAGWPHPGDVNDDVIQRALATARQVLSDDTARPACDRVARYYDPKTKWAGLSFLETAPVEPDTVTVADLHALTVLNAPVDALTTRRLLDDGGTRARIESALAKIRPDTNLAQADPSTFTGMDALWREVYEGCQDPTARNSNPWVTAAKLCARKRPALFPVRDSVVCEGLGLYGTRSRPTGDRRVDWQVFHALMSDRDISDRLQQLGRQVAARGLRCDRVPLRVLDVALWTWLRR